MTGGPTIPAVLTSEVKRPHQLWRDYISQRQPVLLHGLEEPWTTFTEETLLQHAADEKVVVEVRQSAADTYGQGRKQTMLFKDFIQQLRGGATNLYLSTQQVPTGPDGHPHLWAPPIKNVAHLLPLQPQLMGHLVPQAINVWMGAATEGSSSGLHHDFHDNLYVLLRGRKRFRLWPPSAAPGMYTHGQLLQTYPNGRMVYEGQGHVLADGSDARDVKAWRIKQAAQLAVAAAEAAQQHSDDPAAAAAAAEADKKLEAVFEQLLDMEGGSGDEDDLQDDYMDSDDDAADTDTTTSSDSGSDTSSSADEESGDRAAGKHNKQQLQQQDEGPPPSFSQVDLRLSDKQLKAKFPLFPGKASALVVELQAGDMLYLPAGWFHEVTSFSEPGSGGLHMAVNYWFHPPDQLAKNKGAFQHPYSSSFYPDLWLQRLPWLQQEIEATRSTAEVGRPQQQQPASSKKRKQQEQEQQQGAGAKRAAAGQPAINGQTPSATAAANGENGSSNLLVAVSGSNSGTSSRRVSWTGDVSSPRNKYRQSMTHEGTASGSPAVVPARRSQEERLAEQIAQDQAAEAAAAEEGGEDEEDEAPFGMDKRAVQALLAQFMAMQQQQQQGGHGGVLTQRVPLVPGRRHHTVVILKQVPRPRAPR